MAPISQRSFLTLAVKIIVTKRNAAKTKTKLLATMFQDFDQHCERIRFKFLALFILRDIISRLKAGVTRMICKICKIVLVNV
jgi:hypothetical protein